MPGDKNAAKGVSHDEIRIQHVEQPLVEAIHQMPKLELEYDGLLVHFAKAASSAPLPIPGEYKRSGRENNLFFSPKDELREQERQKIKAIHDDLWQEKEPGSNEAVYGLDLEHALENSDDELIFSFEP